MAPPDAQLKKTEVIRSVLRVARAEAGKDEPLLIIELIEKMEAEMQQIVSKQRLYQLLSMMINSGEIATIGRGRDRRYYLRGK